MKTYLHGKKSLVATASLIFQLFCRCEIYTFFPLQDDLWPLWFSMKDARLPLRKCYMSLKYGTYCYSAGHCEIVWMPSDGLGRVLFPCTIEDSYYAYFFWKWIFFNLVRYVTPLCDSWIEANGPEGGETSETPTNSYTPRY